MVTAPVLLFISGAPGSLELILVFVVVLILFGPQRLPSIARSIGRVLNQLRNASQEFKDQVMRIEDESAIDLSGDDHDVTLSQSLHRDEADDPEGGIGAAPAPPRRRSHRGRPVRPGPRFPSASP